MKSILIIGAGRSSTSLIQYVLVQASEHGWTVTVADADPDLASRKVAGHPSGRAAWLDVTKPNDRKDLIRRADVVVSLLPAHLHIEVAHDCIKLKKHLITASYVSKEMYELGDRVSEHSLIFMGEMGLDPGIDHMSAKKKIDEIISQGGTIKSFRSYTGGLIAPESDDNPWHYKFTWNPRNVVLAGQGTAQYLQDGKYKYIPYHQLFDRFDIVDILDIGEYEVYPNRDSLLYREIYGLTDIPNIVRGTLRYPGFCKAWSALVKLGLTDHSFPILQSSRLSYHELIEAFLPDSQGTLKERVARFLDEDVDSPVMEKLQWLGLFSRRKINIHQGTPAMIMEDLLLEKWEMKPDDNDMILMQHEFEYELGGQQYISRSTLSMKGEDNQNTAMSKLVGLPLGIFVKLVMLGDIDTPGVQIPVDSKVYNPVLAELADYGVVFKEKDDLI